LWRIESRHAGKIFRPTKLPSRASCIDEKGNKRIARLEGLNAAAVARKPSARGRRATGIPSSLLREAVECVINGDLATGEAILRNYVNATVWDFRSWRKRTRISAKA
jgi:hypothetical protein